MSQGLSDLDRYLSLLDRRIVELDLRWSRKVSRGMAGLLLLVSHLRQIGREMRATLMSSLSNLDRCLSSLDRRIAELDLRWSRKVSRGMAGLLLLVSHLRQIGREMRATLMSSLSNLDRCL
ncbi:MAG: hypothetical protein OXC38_09720, partial [Gammaproteobacteria bacterium]|nr:hypothetical protein [Gammaproteobacteria bacterium]